MQSSCSLFLSGSSSGPGLLAWKRTLRSCAASKCKRSGPLWVAQHACVHVQQVCFNLVECGSYTLHYRIGSVLRALMGIMWGWIMYS